MPRLPRLTAREICAISERIGSASPAKAEAITFIRMPKERVTVPFHASKTLHPKVLKSIMRDADLEPEDLA